MRTSFNWLLIGTAAILPGAAAWAQSSDTAKVASDEVAVEDIIVTARKRAESLSDAPLSISAFTNADLTAKGLRDISEVALFTPGFSMQNIQGGTEQPFIRGMSTTSFERTLQTSSSFVDGNYFSMLGRTVFFPDLERVEVVRGPQAALFGRATFAGAINYITKGPPEEFAGQLRATVGSYGRRDFHASVGGPISDTVGVRVSANTENFDGQYKNQVDGQDTGVIRRYGTTGALRFKPSDQFTANLKLFGTWFRDDGQVPEYIQPASTLNCFPNAAGVPTYYCGELIVDPKQVRLNLNEVDGGYQNTDQVRGILDLDWEVGEYTLTSVTTLGKQKNATFCDCDYSDKRPLAGAFVSLFKGEIINRSQELRVTSPSDQPLRWIAGLYYFNEESNSFRANTAPIIIPYVDLKNRAVFGSVSFDVTPQVTVNLDGRYQVERQKRSAIPGNPAIDVEYKAFLPRAIVEVRPSDALMLYASAAKGNQPGQFNTGTNIPADRVRVDEEKLWSYEAGAKAEFFDRRLTANLAAYRIDWTNQVFRSEVVGTDGRIVNLLANLGKSRINGIEFDAAAVLSKGWTANATFAYIDAEYVNFLSPNTLRVYRNAQAKGQRLPNTPRVQASLATSYTQPLTRDFDWFVRADYSFRGRQYVSEVNQAYIDQLHLVNVHAGVDSDRLRVDLSVNNLFDSDVPEFATRFSDLNSPGLSRFGYLVRLRTGRTVNLSLIYNF